MNEHLYENAIKDIFSRHPSVQVSGFNGRSYKSGIGSMKAFDILMGEPWRAYPCIHVAGTNGKGSVCSMLASALAESGLRCGLYTSPHLLDFRERIKLIDGSGAQMIDKESVMSFLDRYKSDIEGLSFFEITTAMAFNWFAEQKVDCALIETGLGGRLDSTNIISPILSIVTSIGLDHCAMLGDTREAIAGEKAGIFKPGTDALVWGHDMETDKVFETYAGEIGTKLYFADDLQPPVHIDGMDLEGEYQDSNVRSVLAALSILKDRFDITDTPLEAIKHTASRTSLHGRWEKLSSSPEVICDIGHNPPALQKNFTQLRESGKSLLMVYGIMADKDLNGIAEWMPDGEYFLCAPDSARSMKAEDLESRLHALRPELNLHRCGSVTDAVHQAMSQASKNPSESLVYIGGSTFVVAEALESFR